MSSKARVGPRNLSFLLVPSVQGFLTKKDVRHRADGRFSQSKWGMWRPESQVTYQKLKRGSVCISPYSYTAHRLAHIREWPAHSLSRIRKGTSGKPHSRYHFSFVSNLKFVCPQEKTFQTRGRKQYNSTRMVHVLAIHTHYRREIENVPNFCCYLPCLFQ